MKPYTGPPATLGSTAAAGARIIRHQVEPDAAELAARYGAATPIPEWHKRLVCSKCGSRDVDFVLTGARR